MAEPMLQVKFAGEKAASFEMSFNGQLTEEQFALVGLECEAISARMRALRLESQMKVEMRDVPATTPSPDAPEQPVAESVPAWAQALVDGQAKVNETVGELAGRMDAVEAGKGTGTK